MQVLMHALVESEVFRRKQRNLTRDFTIQSVIHDLLRPHVRFGVSAHHAGTVSRGG